MEKLRDEILEKEIQVARGKQLVTFYLIDLSEIVAGWDETNDLNVVPLNIMLHGLYEKHRLRIHCELNIET